MENKWIETGVDVCGGTVRNDKFTRKITESAVISHFYFKASEIYNQWYLVTVSHLLQSFLNHKTKNLI